MDEIWERAVEAALDGQTDHLATRVLTLDGAVKCVQGRLPPPSVLERFQNLQHLSIANIGASSLEQFPRLGNLQKLILSDNRIAGGLEFLVEAVLDSLRDLDLSNNRIQYIEDLAPLAQLKLISLDLYECPVTRVKDYRSRVFGLIKSLKYLDKIDVEGNERPESDDEDDEENEEDEEDDVDDEEDPGSGEVDGEEMPYRISNGHSERLEGVVDVDEEEESDADDEEAEKERGVDGSSHQANGFRVQAVALEDDEEGSESGEEIDEEEGDDDDDLVEVHEIEDSDNEGVDDEEEDDDVDADEVDNDDGVLGIPERAGRLLNTDGEIDGHEQGEDDEDGDGETGEDEQGIEDGGEYEDEDESEGEDEEYGEGYLVQPVGQVEGHHGALVGGIDVGNEEDDSEEEEVQDDDEVHALPSSSAATRLKRKRDGDDVDDVNEEDDVDEDDDGVDDEEDDDVAEYSKSSKKHH